MPEVALTIKGKNLSQQAIAQLKADIDKTTKALHEQAGANVEVADSTKKTASSYTGLTIALGAASAALGLLTRSIVKSAMEQERMFKSLTAVEDGAKNAEKAMVRLREVAKLPGLSLAQAVQGYTNLRAIDMNAQLAERSLKAFGNALVTVGKGAPQLQLVILALTQMSAKGKVLGQDLRQLQEQLPQIRKVMKQAFGTADVEAVQKKLEETGQTADDFIRTIVTGFEKLPKVMGGAANAVENFNDQWFQTKVQLGEALLPILTQVLDKLGDLMDVFNKLPKPIKDTIGMGIAGGAGLAGLGFALMGISKLILPLIADIKGLSATMLTANTSTGIWASGLTVAAAKLGIIALAAIEVAWAINRIKEAAEKPINIPQIMSNADKENLDRLNKMREAVAKQMTQAEYKPGDMVSGETRYALSGGNPLWDALKRINKSTNPKAQYIETAFGNIDPLMKTEDLLARIDSQIDKIKNKTMGKSVTQSVFGDPKTIQTVWDFEEIKKQFDALSDITGEGFGMSRTQQISWWSDWLGKPSSLSDDAKIGIRNTIKQYSDEIAKEGDKLQKEVEKEAERWRERWQRYAEETGEAFELFDVTPDWWIREEQVKQARLWLDISNAQKEGISKSAEEIGEAFELFDVAPDWYIQEEKKKETAKWQALAEAQKEGIKIMADAVANAFELFDVAPDWWVKQEQDKITKFYKELADAQKKYTQDNADELATAMELYGEVTQNAYEQIMKDTRDYIKSHKGIYENLADDVADIFARLPSDMINNFDNIEDVFKRLLSNLANAVVDTFGKSLGITISNLLTSDNKSGGLGELFALLGKGVGIIGSGMATGGIAPTLTAGVSMGADFMMSGLMFDDPYNDAMAYKSGGRSAIAMTRKSSMDFINNFEAGFAKKTQQQTGEGGLSDKLDKLIGLMQDQKYEFYMDGDQITTKVRKRINKKENRGEWANG